MAGDCSRGLNYNRSDADATYQLLQQHRLFHEALPATQTPTLANARPHKSNTCVRLRIPRPIEEGRPPMPNPPSYEQNHLAKQSNQKRSGATPLQLHRAAHRIQNARPRRINKFHVHSHTDDLRDSTQEVARHSVDRTPRPRRKMKLYSCLSRIVQRVKWVRDLLPLSGRSSILSQSWQTILLRRPPPSPSRLSMRRRLALRLLLRPQCLRPKS